MAMFHAMDMAKIIEGAGMDSQLFFAITSSGNLYSFQVVLTPNGTKIVYFL
jgi:hypothetical protein